MSRHKSVDVLAGYVRRSDLFKGHAGAWFPVMTERSRPACDAMFASKVGEVPALTLRSAVTECPHCHSVAREAQQTAKSQLTLWASCPARNVTIVVVSAAKGHEWTVPTLVDG